jgi:glutathionylspermidine synthase
MKGFMKIVLALGLWMIDQECCSMSIRESSGPITDNLSSFVPHYFA